MGPISVPASRLELEEERAERKRLEALLEFAPAFIIGITTHGTIDFINRTLPQHDKKDVIGSSWLQYFPPDRHALMTAALRNAFDTGLTQIYETTTPGPDGAPVWFESQLAPIRVGGQIVGAVLVSQDVTERKRAQAELLAARHLALLGTLAAGVAHEINTPIQFIGDSVQFLRDATHDLLQLFEKIQALRQAAVDGRPLEQVVEEAAEVERDADLPFLRENIPAAFARCLEGLGRVTTIVRSLKDFAHPSQEEMSAVDLNRIVQGTLAIAAGEYKYVADLQTDLGELPPVTCHSGEIGQAVLNIVVNAAHAIGDVVAGTDSKGLITVRTRHEGDMALIAISDSGGGIPERVQPRIFDPFFTTKEVGKGTGQGLAIASSTVRERHGGTLTFETAEGRGTTFFIRLPLARAA
jgi:two-component system NtrC family sensor kinase